MPAMGCGTKTGRCFGEAPLEPLALPNSNRAPRQGLIFLWRVETRALPWAITGQAVGLLPPSTFPAPSFPLHPSRSIPADRSGGQIGRAGLQPTLENMQHRGILGQVPGQIPPLAVQIRHRRRHHPERRHTQARLPPLKPRHHPFAAGPALAPVDPAFRPQRRQRHGFYRRDRVAPRDKRRRARRSTPGRIHPRRPCSALAGRGNPLAAQGARTTHTRQRIRNAQHRSA